MLYDMKIGIKTQAPQLNWKDHLAKLQTQVVDEQRFLDDLNRSLSNPDFIERAPEHIVQSKREKREAIKITIEQLNIEITTLKIKNK